MSWKKLYLTLCFAISVFSSSAFSSEFQIGFVPSSRQISGLKWDDSKVKQGQMLPMEDEGEQGGAYTVTLHGKYLNSHGELIFERKTIVPKEDGSFELSVKVESDRTEIHLTAVNEVGAIEKETDLLMLPDGSRAFSRWEQTKRFSFYFGIGGNSLSYSQTQLNSFSNVGPFLRGGGTYSFNEGHWDLGFDLYSNLVLSSGPLSGNQMGILSFAPKIGHRFLVSPVQKWKFEAAAGYHFLTTVFSSSQFGFRNIGGPEVSFEAIYSIDEDHSVKISPKYLPVLGSVQLVSLDNLNASMLVSYLFPVQLFNQKNKVSIDIEASFLQFAMSGNQVKMATLTFGLTSFFYF